MAHRYWKLHESMGYAGTDSEEEIDLVDDWNYSEKEVENMTDEDAKKELETYAWETAIEKVSAWAEPIEK